MRPWSKLNVKIRTASDEFRGCVCVGECRALYNEDISVFVKVQKEGDLCESSVQASIAVVDVNALLAS